MPRLPRRLAVTTTCALVLSAAAPALAGAASSHADLVKARTALVTKIANATRAGIGVSYRASRGGQPVVDPLLPNTGLGERCRL